MALVDYFLKIDGIQGESQDKTHKNEIEIESFSWGAIQSGTASPRRRHGGREGPDAGLPPHHARQQSEPETDAGLRSR